MDYIYKRIKKRENKYLKFFLQKGVFLKLILRMLLPSKGFSKMSSSQFFNGFYTKISVIVKINK